MQYNEFISEIKNYDSLMWKSKDQKMTSAEAEKIGELLVDDMIREKLNAPNISRKLQLIRAGRARYLGDEPDDFSGATYIPGTNSER